MVDPESEPFSRCLVCNRGESISEANGHDEMMIQCDVCSYWFHVSCVNLEEVDVVDIDQYHCPKCELNCGSSILRERRNSHRHDSSDAQASHKNTECGTRDFIEKLKHRNFSRSSGLAQVLNDGGMLTRPWLENKGFKHPILVLSANGLELRLPLPMNLQDIENLVGAHTLVDVLEAQRQQFVKMKLGRFVSFFTHPDGNRIFNLVKLNLKNIGLADVVDEPDVVRRISWLRQNWAFKLSAVDSVVDQDEFQECLSQAPDVAKWLSIAMKDSYTDFHINCHGTSMWCAMLWGEKVFFLIEPTQNNLEAYEKWRQSPNCTERFFADLVKGCCECPVRAGQVLFIPSGWIYAVLTVSDSLMFGGNFLHSFDIEMQLKTFETEQRLGLTNVDEFPNFKLINWFAARHYIDYLQELADDGAEAPAYLITGLSCLKTSLNSWLHDQSDEDIESLPIPENFSIDSMSCSKIVTKLGKLVQKHNVSLKKIKIRGEGRTKSHKSGKTRKGKRRAEQKPLEEVAEFSTSLNDAAEGKAQLADEQQLPEDSVVGDENVGQTLHSGVDGSSDLAQDAAGSPTDALIDSAPVCDTESIKSPTVVNTDGLSSSQSQAVTSLVKPGVDQFVPRGIVGFSLLDIQKSLQSSSVVDSGGSGGGGGGPTDANSDFMARSRKVKRQKRHKQSSGADTPSAATTTSADDAEATIKVSSMFTVSKSGRVPKVNAKVLGKADATTQYVKEFGVCRQDDEFIYPSLNDSDCDATSSGLKERFASEPLHTPPRHESFDAILRKTLEHVNRQSSNASRRQLPSIKCKKGKATAKQRLASKLRIQKFMQI